MSEEVKYEYIRLEPAENGFSLSYTCVKKNPMKPQGTFESCMMHEDKKEVFQTTDSVSWDQALDSAAAKMKELYRYNRENKKEDD